MEAASILFGKVMDLVFRAAKREINYVWYCTKNVDKLRNESQKLKDMKAILEHRINTAQEKGELLLDGVQIWIKNTDTELSTVAKFLEEEATAKKTCFNSRLCVNLSTLRRYSKIATRKTHLLLQIYEDGKTYDNCVSIPTPTPSILNLYERKNLDDINTHKLTLKEILTALADESVQIVGIYGLGGVGKTTLAKEVATEVKNLYADIVFITVSQTVDGKVIQEKVEAAAKRIIIGEKVLIILDDMWEYVELSEVGIPCGNSHMNCKILLTSRSKNVCESMNVQRSICVKTLKKDEAWVLFKRVVGERLETDITLKNIAEKVAEECGGLPLFIQVVGKALKSKPTYLWEAALHRLQYHDPLEIHSEIRKAFTHLKLSYDYLESEEAKSCFLMCSMFKEDGIIRLNDLVNYGVGLGIFNNLDSITDARYRVEIAVDTLKSTFLLLPEEDDSTVRMHDVVRDVALLIASKGIDNFLVKAGKGLTEWQSRNNTSQSYTRISLVNNQICKLPVDQELHFPLVDAFLIQSNEITTIPDEFIRSIREVKVLDMSWNKILSLPESIKLLTKLRTLDLSWNRDLNEISILGELKHLEILKIQAIGIETIPEEIGRLNNLRLLDVNDCLSLSHITPGVISRLICLEELYVEFYGKYLVELSELTSFKTLHLRVRGYDIFNGDHFEKMETLTWFSIQIGDGKDPFKHLRRSHLKRRLYVAGSNISPLKKVVQVSNAIILNEIEDMYSILPGVCEESFDGLKSISLIQCPNISCLVKTLGERKPTDKFFSQVEEITLEDLNRLKLLWDCPNRYISFRNLQTIRIVSCWSLLTLFPETVAQGLVNLNEIDIQSCGKMVAVISERDEQKIGSEIELTGSSETEQGIHDADIVFPSLTKISLSSLYELESFCSGDSTIKYPSLKFIHVSSCKKMTRWGYGVQDIPKISFEHHGTECSINDIIAHEARGYGDFEFGTLHDD
ncbi:hypothetical protein LXL04_014775 [Taraxacum kok-saghyz]